MAPSKRYLYGFLVPRVTGAPDDDDDDDDDDPELADDETAEAGNDPGDGGQDDPAPKRRPILPSSIGLSVLLAPAAGDAVQVRVSYADYQPDVEAPPEGDGGARRQKPVVRWRRVAWPRDSRRRAAGADQQARPRRRADAVRDGRGGGGGAGARRRHPRAGAVRRQRARRPRREAPTRSGVRVPGGARGAERGAAGGAARPGRAGRPTTGTIGSRDCSSATTAATRWATASRPRSSRRTRRTAR